MRWMLWAVICCLSIGASANEKAHDIVIGIKINCPESVEYEEFVKSIPPGGDYATGFEEWKTSFIRNMTQLIQLVESGKIYNSRWSVNTDVSVPAQSNEN